MTHTPHTLLTPYIKPTVHYRYTYWQNTQNSTSFTMKKPIMHFLPVLLLKINSAVAFSPTYNAHFTIRLPTPVQVRVPLPVQHQTAILHTNPRTSTALFDSSSNHKEPNLSIEYCTGCRWMFRASWLMQECLTTFNDEIGSITLVPSKPPSPGGTFLIKLNNDVIWDRKFEGSFPEAKQLKQRIRDKISPQKDLGHSDVVKNEAVPDSVALESSKGAVDTYCQECEDTKMEVPLSKPNDIDEKNGSDSDKDSILKSRSLMNNINITYCTGCEWMMRATWICQELLSAFQEELEDITLTPSRQPEEVGQFVSIQPFNTFLLYI